VAAAIWFLFTHHRDIWWSGNGWPVGHGMMMGSGMGFVMILFWGVVVMALILLVSSALSGRSPRRSEDPLEILRRRYARGEIDKKRFDAMQRDLQQAEVDHER
jgi:putative membrane protein